MMERHISQHSAEKLINEMNSKPHKLNGKHCFTNESEEDQNQRYLKNPNTSKGLKPKPDEERGFRPHTAGNQKLTGDYMRPTVNADLKRDNPVPSIAKT